MLTFAPVQGPHEYYSSKSQLANDDSQHFEATDVLLAADDVDPILSGSSSKLCVPGQSIASAAAFMRGHGTYITTEESPRVVSSMVGYIEKVNKLLSVRPLRSRYMPEIGDLVVGRITGVQQKRWKVDIKGRQEAVLMLSSINLPGGVQRRKLESDELQMRTFFQEGDLVVAEVQAFFGDGSVSLHTRSLKYGKLRNGQLCILPPALIQRLRSHFLTLRCGVDVILGVNGYVWVRAHTPYTTQGADSLVTEEQDYAVYSSINSDIEPQTRAAISRIQMILQSLEESGLLITEMLLNTAHDLALHFEEESEDGQAIWCHQQKRQTLIDMTLKNLQLR